MSRSVQRILHGIATVLLLAVPSFVYPWAPEGHEIIAIVAEQRLEPTTRKAVEALLEGESFVKAANWADQVRNKPDGPLALRQHPNLPESLRANQTLSEQPVCDRPD
jgi:hypothetical protein